MERVIFLDRDGTINEEVSYLYKPEDLKFLPFAVESIRSWNENGYKVVVVTNQAGVARGYYTEQAVQSLHVYLNQELQKQGAHIDHFFYCPHHPEKGVGDYKKKCHCRKPETGMLEMAEQYYEVDKKQSYMIGDKIIDMEAGYRYGVKRILVGTGYGNRVGSNPPYDFFAETLSDAVLFTLAGK